MANTKISALPASTTPLAGTEVLPIVQSTTTKQVSVANLTAGRAVATGALSVTGAATVSTTLAVTGATTLSSVATTTGTISTTPSGSTDIANKAYVDTVAQGLDTKASVVAGTTGNITLSGTQTVDGVVLIAGDRVLVKNQTAPADNGLYLCAASSWTRTTDMDTWAEVPGAYVFVEGGSTLADTGWVCTSDAGGTIGVTAITWAQFSGAGSGVSSISFGSTGLTPSSVTTGAVVVSGTLAVANGGTGTSSPSLVQGTNITVTGAWPNQTITAAGSSGTVSSVALSGGTTGLTVTGSPITTSGTITLAGVLAVANGGTGTSSPSIVQGTNITVTGTWPNQTIASSGGGIAYTAVKTANYTAANNDGVLTNTTGGAFTVTLPTSPAVGNIVVVVDSFSQWGTNNLTIDPTASIKIANNTAGDTLVCDITGITVTLVYTGATYGWNVSAQIGGNSGTVVTLTGTQTLTNKTLTAPVLTSPNITTALTLTSASGTSGDVLTSAGSGNAPTWTTPGSGALTLLSTVTASTSSTVDIETTFNSTYDAYLLVATGVTISATDNFYCRMKIGGSYLSTNTYQNHVHMMKGDDGAYTSIIQGTAQINITGNLPTSTASHSIDFVMRVYTPSSTTFQKLIDWQGVTLNSTPKLMGFVGGGLNTGTGALTGVQFFTGGGTVDAGKFRLYGIANS